MVTPAPYIVTGSSTTISTTPSLSTAASSTKQTQILARSTSSRNGVCGLQNLGNTCFMNSGLQCLSHLQELTKIFLEDSYVEDLNPRNKIGTGCKLAKAYAVLLKEMWYGANSSVSPWYFKKELGDFVPQFYGFQQHDSHELISYVLDLLHEDLNRVKTKPPPRELATANLPEPEIAEQFWQNHLDRNRSFIVDLMHGQYRSQVTCPDCNNVSLAFDPFVSVTVSFTPKTTVKWYEAILVPVDIKAPVTKFRVQLARGSSVADLKAGAGRVLGVGQEELMFTKVFNYAVIEVLEDRMELASLSQHFSVVALQVPKVHGKIPILMDIFKDPENFYYPKSSYAYSRVLLIDENSNLKQVHLQVFKYFQSVKSAKNIGESPPEQSDAELEAAYSQAFSKGSTHIYKLNVVNLQREKVRFAPNVSSTASRVTIVCDFCRKKDCTNCQFPNDPSVSFSSFIHKNQSGKLFRLEAILPVSHLQEYQALVETSTHPSVGVGLEEERRLKEQPFSLEECLSFSGQPEKLDSENEVYCSRCKKHVQAIKQMGIYRLPKILILHLKRFRERGYHKEKDERLIRFPLEGLDMTPFCRCPDSGPQIYDLFAVSNHFGGLGGGHYTAYGKNHIVNQWYGFNDSSTSLVRGDPTETIVTSAAYVLFYRRREETVPKI